MADVRQDNRSRSWKTAPLTASVAGDNTIVAALTLQRIKVYSIVFSSTGTVNARWKNGPSIDLTGTLNFQAREGYAIASSPPSFLLSTSPGNALILNLSVAVPVSGWIGYWDDDTT